MWTEGLYVKGAIITFKLDTGSTTNLVNKVDSNEVKTIYFFRSNIPIKSYNGLSINAKGKCNLKVSAKVHSLMFVVVPERHESLLGD